MRLHLLQSECRWDRCRQDPNGTDSEAPETELPPEVRLSLTPEALAVAQLLLGGYTDLEVKKELGISRRRFEALRVEIENVLRA